MSVPRKDLPDLMRGDTREYEMTFLDENSQPIDISNTTMWSTLKLDRTDPDPGVLQKSVTFPADANSQAGIGYLKWDEADTQILEPGVKYWYDFQWVRPNTSDVTTTAWGQIKVVQDVTETTV